VRSESRYWQSRFRALGWSTLYSIQFEVGPISEATIGKTGKKKGTGGFVDLVVTPIGIGHDGSLARMGLSNAFVPQIENDPSGCSKIILSDRSTAEDIVLGKDVIRTDTKGATITHGELNSTA
jgi:hypothetical protein